MASQTNQQQVFTLTITAGSVDSTDERFTIDNLNLGDSYKPLNVYFEKADGTIINRAYRKRENKISNQTLPRLACQVFEEQISGLSAEDKKSFPVCKYSPNAEAYCGIYLSLEEFKEHYNTLEYVVYHRDNDEQFVIYCWNIFSTINFVQECLKLWGEDGDEFIMEYREKTAYEKVRGGSEEDNPDITDEYSIKDYASMLLESKNLIFRGAPGTGKSYLAKQIAADIISNGKTDNFDSLTDEQKQQMEFVQFHPSYDYSDFVEGLRPKVNDDGTMGFELQDGIFKRFVARARTNYENSQKTIDIIKKEISVQEAMDEFFSEIELGVYELKTKTGNKFTITDVDDKHIYISIPGNPSVNKLTLNLDEIRRMLESEEMFDAVKDITKFFGKTNTKQAYSYDLIIFNKILEKMKSTTEVKPVKEEQKDYIFIIDEINRGEISKIFGELFFSIDPGYRGEKGAVTTQYANMHEDPKEKFYIPENVYIIGTMNDIDRSVDTFDFAMRRRFRFVELKADEHIGMLDDLGDKKEKAINRMRALNQAIYDDEDLNENYQIGAAYFLKLKDLDYDQLWDNYLEPLLQEYVRGMYNENGKLQIFKNAYYGETASNKNNPEGEVNGEAPQNQG